MRLSSSRFPLAIKLGFGLCALLVFGIEPIFAQQICANCTSTYQSPAAAPGGPYLGMTGQSISFNDAGSWSGEGWITGYYWDFGDGTDWGQEPNPTHQYSADGVYTVTLWVSDSNGNWDSTQKRHRSSVSLSIASGGVSKNILRFCIVILVSAISVCAQSKIDENGVLQVPDHVAAKRKLLLDRLRKPEFITLRLTYGYAFEKPVATPQPYLVGDSMFFELFVSQSIFENIMIDQSRWAYYEYHPELRRDSEILSYSKEAQKAVAKAEDEPPSAITVTLVPGREHRWATVRLEDWYDRLGPGHYELSVRKRFVWDGDWVQSNSVTFEVQQRKPPTPIAAGVFVELVPDAFQNTPKQAVYRLSGKDYFTVVVVNNSDRELSIPVIDLYYGNRPQLFKDGILLPYSDETLKLLERKETTPYWVELGKVFLAPHTRSGLHGLDLRTWYGQLGPGNYKLINRRRFEIDGPWTADSEPLLFEIVR